MSAIVFWEIAKLAQLRTHKCLDFDHPEVITSILDRNPCDVGGLLTQP